MKTNNKFLDMTMSELSEYCDERLVKFVGTKVEQLNLYNVLVSFEHDLDVMNDIGLYVDGSGVLVIKHDENEKTASGRILTFHWEVDDGIITNVYSEVSDVKGLCENKKVSDVIREIV